VHNFLTAITLNDKSAIIIELINFDNSVLIAVEITYSSELQIFFFETVKPSVHCLFSILL